MAIEITDNNIEAMLKENKIALIDFWAPWCGPCRMLGPIIEELSNENPDILIGKVNVDENSDTAIKYGIRGIPALIFFKDGEIVDKVVGVKPKVVLQASIDGLKG